MVQITKSDIKYIKLFCFLLCASSFTYVMSFELAWHSLCGTTNFSQNPFQQCLTVLFDMMWYMDTHPWCDQFNDSIWWKEIILIIWNNYWFNIVMSVCFQCANPQGTWLCSRVHDVKCDVGHTLQRALISKAMIRWHIKITSIAAQYGLKGYRPSVLRGMDVFPTLCHYDTRGHGREVPKHAPQVIVMMTIRCLLREARSAR